MYHYQKKIALDINSFASDMKHFVSCYNFLFKQGLLTKKYDRHLDLGGGHGHFSFLLHVMNKINYSLSVDKRPFIKTDNFNHFLIYYRFLIRRKITKLFRSKVKLGKFGYTDTNSIYFNLPLIPKKIPNISYTQKDIYDIKGKYDLVTSVSSLEFFKMKKIFKKVSNLLNKNGVFFIMVDYWWYPANSSGIYLDEPFKLQRNNFNKLKKTIKNKNLDLNEIKRRYFYYHVGLDTKPTIDDYIKLAYKNNLRLQSFERHVPSEYIESRLNFIPKDFVGSGLNAKNKSPNKVKIKNLNKVIKDIKKFQKNIKIEDLFTHYTYLIFQKN